MIGPLIDLSEREPAESRVMRDTSLEAFEALLPKLADMEFRVYAALCTYIARTGNQDATGGELAVFAGLSVLSVRPRLTALLKRGLVLAHGARESRVAAERRSHPVSPVLPLAAVVRAHQIRERR
jgi:hypothetical protein